MPELARPLRAKARSSVALLAGALLASCMPLQDLDGYAQPPVGANGGTAGSAGGAGAEQPLTETPPAEQPQVVDGMTEQPVPGLPLQGGGSGSGQEPDDDGTPVPGATTDAGVPVDAAAASPCAAQELLGPNGRCYFFETALLSWSGARAACQGRGAGWDFVSILSAADAQFLGETLPFEAWIGASDLASEGSWTWAADDRSFWVGGQDGLVADGAYANWNATEPNGGTTTNCARALPRSFGSPNLDAPWADLDCAQLRGAICEAHPLN
jgi:hypothetical protein